MSVDIVCGKCGNLVHRMSMLKPIKESVAGKKETCTKCGSVLSTSEFSVDAREIGE